jgi:DNA oxidative demethylase
MSLSLFDMEPCQLLAADAYLLRGFAEHDGAQVLDALHTVLAGAALRHMLTPGGRPMAVAMSNCGALGWISDRRGYRYATHDPETAQPWPAMPALFLNLAQRAAQAAGFPDFVPDACLINRYAVGDRLSLHQDKDERDFAQPIVSVSLGLDAVFLLGGSARQERPRRVPLVHGDVVVWGGLSRLNYHGVAAIAPASHPLTGSYRFNLTLRKAA